jgi:predicted PurR-regulated permease PerM
MRFAPVESVGTARARCLAAVAPGAVRVSRRNFERVGRILVLMIDPNEQAPTREPSRIVHDRQLLRALVITALALALGGLMWMIAAVFDRVHNTLVVIVFAILFAYLVYPPVKWLGNRRVPIPIAGVIVYAALGVVVIAALAWLTPAVAVQVEDLSHNFPAIVSSAQKQIIDPTNSPLLGRLPESARTAIASNAGKAGAIVGALAGKFGSNALGILTGTSAAIIDIFLVLGSTLLILGDLVPIQRFGVRLVPRRYRVATVSFMDDVDKVIGGFVRGQVLLALGVGVAGTIVLLGVGVPYAILLGLLSGVVSIVPLVGPVIALIPVVLIAFFTVGLVKVIIVGVLFAVILIVQQNVIPLIVSKSVGVTPLVVFVALLLGSEAFGILGALLSIPVAGILRVAAERLFPPDPESDATLVRARNLAGEPPSATRAATGIAEG